MPRGLYRDDNGLVVVSHGGSESPMPVRNYVAAGLSPPVEALPTRAGFRRGGPNVVDLEKIGLENGQAEGVPGL